MWADTLEGMRRRKLLWMLLQEERYCGPQDDRRQGRDDCGYRRMGKDPAMGGCNDSCEDRAYSHTPGQEPEAETISGKT
eukprot:9005379-Heterocapsa_arctica.AAC.1